MRQLTGWLLLVIGAALCSCNHSATTVETQDITVGTGPIVENGDTVILAYTGTFKDGSVFDTNVPPANKVATKPPFTFVVTPSANKETITGMNLGVQGMHLGGERRITVPPELGYGDKAMGPIPANSELFFDVKLLGIIKYDTQSTFAKTDKKEGVGVAAKKNDWVTITYTRELLNGFPLESSKEESGPVQFQAGTGEMGDAKALPNGGLIDGVIGMKVGGVRIAVMTTDLAFDPNAGVPVEVNNGLVRFTITMLRISKTPIPSKK